MIDEDMLELQIPPEAEYVGTARLFLAAAGRHFELSEESVADLKVAVSEVCAAAIEDRTAPEPLRIVVRPRLEALQIEVTPNEPGLEADPVVHHLGPPQPVSFEDTMREPLVRALFPEATYEPQRHVLRLSVPWEVLAEDSGTD